MHCSMSARIDLIGALDSLLLSRSRTMLDIGKWVRGGKVFVVNVRIIRRRTAGEASGGTCGPGDIAKARFPLAR